MPKKILQQKEKTLRQVAKEIPLPGIKTLKIKKILKEMSASLASQSDGVAIAAPQIGYSLQIFVVSGKIFEAGFQRRGLSKENQRDELRESAHEARTDSDPGLGKPAEKDLVFINPKISKLSRDKEWLPEGCLSVRWLYGRVFRSKKATVTAYDENGKKFTRGASGLLAQIFQHETDHLNGVLFIDRAKDIKEELPK
ncbi:MAG TPA: peptide deformylase [Candidatus Paceibacterota bacterium]|jgi:peptide deformylase|nr:peptide deformylase [Candidatus Paceibacterota bacterium]